MHSIGKNSKFRNSSENHRDFLTLSIYQNICTTLEQFVSNRAKISSRERNVTIKSRIGMQGRSAVKLQNLWPQKSSVQKESVIVFINQ